MSVLLICLRLVEAIGGIRFMGLELQMVVSRHIGAGKQSQVLWRTASFLTAESALQQQEWLVLDGQL